VLSGAAAIDSFGSNGPSRVCFGEAESRDGRRAQESLDTPVYRVLGAQITGRNTPDHAIVYSGSRHTALSQPAFSSSAPFRVRADGPTSAFDGAHMTRRHIFIPFRDSAENATAILAG